MRELQYPKLSWETAETKKTKGMPKLSWENEKAAEPTAHVSTILSAIPGQQVTDEQSKQITDTATKSIQTPYERLLSNVENPFLKKVLSFGYNPEKAAQMKAEGQQLAEETKNLGLLPAMNKAWGRKAEESPVGAGLMKGLTGIGERPENAPLSYTAAEIAGTVAPFGAAYKGARLLTKGITKAIPKIAATGAIAGAAVGAEQAVAESGDAKEIAKRALLYGGLGAVGDVAFEKVAIPIAKAAYQKVMARRKVSPLPVVDDIEREVAKNIGVDWDNMNDTQKAAIRKVVAGMQPEPVQSGRLLPAAQEFTFRDLTTADKAKSMGINRQLLLPAPKELKNTFIDEVYKGQYNDSITIKKQLAKYYSGFDGEALDNATKAIADLEAVERGNIPKAERGLENNLRGNTGTLQNKPYKTVGLSFSRDLINTGKVNLTGHKIADTKDLATISQVFRDPRFETFRIVYTKGNEVVGVDALTSRIPGSATGFLDGKENYLFKTSERMKRISADGYYLLHNHPSGSSVKPSKSDISLTHQYANKLPGFKGHIIINSNKYTEMYPVRNGFTVELGGKEDLPLNLGQDRLLTPSMPHELLGTNLMSPENLAQAAKRLQTNNDVSVAFFINSRGEVTGLQEISNSMIRNNWDDNFRNFLRRQAVEHGGNFVSIVGDKSIAKELGDMVATDDLLDALIKETGKTFRQGHPKTDPWMGIDAIKAGRRAPIPKPMENQPIPFKTQIPRQIIDKTPIPPTPLQFKQTIEVPKVYDKNAFIGKETVLPSAPLKAGDQVEYSVTVNGKPDTAIGRITEIKQTPLGSTAVIESGLDFRGKPSIVTRPVADIKQPFYLKPNEPGEPYAPFMPEYKPPTPESYAAMLRKEKGVVAAKSDTVTIKPGDPNQSRKYATPEGYNNWKMSGGDKEDAMPRPRNTHIDDVYDELSRDLIGTSMSSDSIVADAAKDVKGSAWPLRYGITDIYRNLRNAFGEHFGHVKKNYLDPFDKSKGDYAKAIQAETDDLYNNVVKKFGITKGSQESAAVQWLGEGKRSALVPDEKTGQKMWKEVEYTLSDLQKEFPQSWEKIVEADKWFRAKYDAYVDKINQVLKYVYPYVEKEVGKLRDTRTSMVEQRLRTSRDQAIPDDAKQGVLEILNKQLRDVDQQIDDMLTNRRLPKRKDYYRHFQELGEGFKAFENILSSSAQIDPRLVGVSENTLPKTKWASFMQHRGQGKYQADAVGGYLDYIKPANYKVFIEQHIPKFRQLAKDLADNTIESKNANNLIEHLQMFANDLAGKTNPYFDRGIQKTVTGRKAMSVVNWVNGRVMSNAVLGNARSLLAQPANIPVGMSRLKAPAQMTKAAGQMIDAIFNPASSIKQAFKQSDFLSERYLDSVWDKFDDKILSQPKVFAAWALRGMDELSTKWIWSTAYNKAKTQGAQNASKWADDFTRAIVAGRGIGEMPLALKSKTAQLFIPFQIEVNNMWRVFGDALKEKDYAGLAIMPLALWLFNAGTREVVGDDITFNPVGAVTDALKEKKITPGKVIGRLAGETLSNMPGGQYVADYIPDNIRQKYLARNDPTRYGTGGLNILKPIERATSKLGSGDLSGAALELGTGYLTPFGGSQIKRSIQGAKALNVLPNALGIPGEVGLTKKGPSLKFPIKPTLENKAKGLVFGPYATDQGKKYSMDSLNPLGTEQTKAFVYAEKKGVDAEKMYNILLQFRELQPIGNHKGVTDAQKTQVINKSELPQEHKLLLNKLFVKTEVGKKLLPKPPLLEIKK